MGTLLERLLRTVFTAGHKLLRRRIRRRPGVHAVALTPERRIILVRLRYAPGWRLPGGGRSGNEAPRDAALRELREEIGLVGHGKIRALGTELVVVEDVQYRPSRWSWEVERVGEFDLDALPSDLSPFTARWLEVLRTKV